jgi:hypothetical protein
MLILTFLCPLLLFITVVECNNEHYLYIFNEFHSIFSLTPSDQQILRLDPLSYVCYLIGENRVECSDFIEAFSKISLKACMHYYRNSDQEGFRKALIILATRSGMCGPAGTRGGGRPNS